MRLEAIESTRLAARSAEREPLVNGELDEFRVAFEPKLLHDAVFMKSDRAGRDMQDSRRFLHRIRIQHPARRLLDMHVADPRAADARALRHDVDPFAGDRDPRRRAIVSGVHQARCAAAGRCVVLLELHDIL